ncbi:YhcN/YlaJ family sporulation lipoprotein [Xylanibacillus composti]|nr:YhcN/YlaJ family sporulation lipoprotein [Xylanibacillus composti]MDT9724389.1 YhcN/YlaJ family sporulation lipoprotein [Xylanibacillus composti]
MMKILLTLLLMMMFVVGCAQNRDHAGPPSPQQNNQEIKVRQSVPEKPEINDPEHVANRLEELAESIPRVESANCVVFGNTAIVGINVPGNMDRSMVGTIKYSVAEALRKDPHGAHAIVTADIDIASRLEEIAEDIRNGHPVSGFADELSDIIGRIMPQLPKDVMPQHHAPAQSETQQQLER